MPEIEYKGQLFAVDSEGFLLDFQAWTPEWADYIRHEEGLEELEEDHWAVINMLQDYYRKNKVPPMVRIISKLTGFKLKYIYEIFPSGPGKGACKMAGLPKPAGCV